MLIQCEKARFRSELAIQANAIVTRIPTIPITIDTEITPFDFCIFYSTQKGEKIHLLIKTIETIKVVIYNQSQRRSKRGGPHEKYVRRD